nr:MAG TPA: hypothetical protein [Siphoviridae sp. ctQHO9]
MSYDCQTIFTKKLILFYHFGTCQRLDEPSLVYKKLRKVL